MHDFLLICSNQPLTYNGMSHVIAGIHPQNGSAESGAVDLYLVFKVPAKMHVFRLILQK